MEEWERVWKDKSTPPYEIIRVHRLVLNGGIVAAWYNNNQPEGFEPYKLFYRTFQRAVENSVWAKDELDAFMKGTKMMDKFKAKSEYAKRRKSNG